MDEIEFWKMSGSGNDFILIDNRHGAVGDDMKGRLVQRACRRRESVGADGVIFVLNSDRFDFRWQYFNADGGEVEMCGNGARCVSRFAFLKGIAGAAMTFETLAGPVSSKVDGRKVRVEMPRPSGLLMNLDLEHQSEWKTLDFVNTGVPHVVVGVEDLAGHPVREQGRAIRYHARFSPEGTNADFMKVLDTGELEVRTYERGVEDETLACGTGAIACALVACSRELVKPPVEIKTRGGEILTIDFTFQQDDPAAFDRVWLEGNTTLVYRAELDPEAF
jgi:diaminopimelate epimerase